MWKCSYKSVQNYYKIKKSVILEAMAYIPQISLFSDSPVSPVEVYFFRKFMFQLNVDNTALATKSGIYPATLAESVYWKSLGSMVLQYPILQYPWYSPVSPR